jgi:hypothetical protein
VTVNGMKDETKRDDIKDETKKGDGIRRDAKLYVIIIESLFRPKLVLL